MGCSSTYTHKGVTGKNLPLFKGHTLNKKEITLPDDFLGQKSILLIGYVQNSQFDIDRWLIGLDMQRVVTPVFEIPAIKGFWPKLFRNQIDNGMRRGIPNELWKIVITVYDDGEKIQEFLGNEKPGNARIVILDEQGEIIYFYDRGFSVNALKEALKFVERENESSSSL